MIKKSITFEDFDGNQRVEDFYFHLSKAELTEMELSEKGGLTEYVKKIVAEEDGKKLVVLFKDLLTKSVGHRSEDGRRFIKSQEIVDDFVQTDAYSELFMELATNAERAAEFVSGVIPASMQDEVKNAMKNPETIQLPETGDSTPSWITEGREPTEAEVREATPEQLRLAYTRKTSKPSAEITPPTVA